MKEQELVEKLVEETRLIIENLNLEAEISAEMMHGDNEKNYINIDISGENLSELIGFRGKILKSLERVLFLILRSFEIDEKLQDVRVVVDVNEYKQKRLKDVEELALKAIDEVREVSQPIELPVMGPSERRIVHMTAKKEGIESISQGDEGERRVVLKPKN